MLYFVVSAVVLPLLLIATQLAFRQLQAVLGAIVDSVAGGSESARREQAHTVVEVLEWESNVLAGLQFASIALMVGELGAVVVVVFEPTGWLRWLAAAVVTLAVAGLAIGLVRIPEYVDRARRMLRERVQRLT